MRNAPEPRGYDDSYVIDGVPSDCQIAVGFDRRSGEVPRFLVKLYHALSSHPLRWEPIARFDHNAADPTGHDIYAEGIHIDLERISGEAITVRPYHQPLPRNRGIVIRWCVDYFERYADWFVEVYMGVKEPSDPPDWPG